MCCTHTWVRFRAVHKDLNVKSSWPLLLAHTARIEPDWAAVFWHPRVCSMFMPAAHGAQILCAHSACCASGLVVVLVRRRGARSARHTAGAAGGRVPLPRTVCTQLAHIHRHKISTQDRTHAENGLRSVVCGVAFSGVFHTLFFVTVHSERCREFGAGDGAAHAPKDTVQALPPGSQWLLVLPPQQSAARSFSVRAPTGYGCES